MVITAVFNAFFVAAVADKAPWATFAWTAALSVSYLAVLLTAPFVGAWADAHAAKKKLLLLFHCRLRAVHRAPLFRQAPAPSRSPSRSIILSNFFFATGENLIAAFLTELADSKAMGRVSGWGWAFGYLGRTGFAWRSRLFYITCAPEAGPERERSSSRSRC